MPSPRDLVRCACSQRHLLLQAQTLEFLLALALYDLLSTLWTSVVPSRCRPAAVPPALLPGSAAISASLLCAGLVVATAVASRHRADAPTTLLGSEGLAASVGIFTATLSLLLGWSFRDAYLGLADYVRPGRPTFANQTLIGLLLVGMVIRMALDRPRKTTLVQPLLRD